MTAAEIKGAAEDTLGKYMTPDRKVRLFTKSKEEIEESRNREQEALSRKRHEVYEKLNKLYEAHQIDVEDYLAGNGMLEQEAKEGEVLYCQECRSDSCTNWRHCKYPLDERIYPMLAELHAKGYGTVFCCSGHADQVGRHYDTHIEFYKQQDFVLPTGFLFGKATQLSNNGVRIAAAVPPHVWKQKVLIEEAQEILDRNLQSLEKWVHALLHKE